MLEMCCFNRGVTQLPITQVNLVLTIVLLNVESRGVGVGGGWGGGGTLNYAAYLGSNPASTLHPPKKYQEFQAPQKNI